jgi:hypothetical protein
MWSRDTSSSRLELAHTDARLRVGVIIRRLTASAAAVPFAVALFATIGLMSDWRDGAARGADLPRPPMRSTPRQSGHRHSAGVASAGRPAAPRPGPAAVGAEPTPAELDQRERALIKRGLESGPPLPGRPPDMPPTNAHRSAAPPPTEPAQ